MMRNMKAVACAAALVCGLYAEASVITNWVYVVTNVYTREVVVITNKVKNTHTNYYYTNHVSTVSNHYDVTYKTNVNTTLNYDVSQMAIGIVSNHAERALYLSLRAGDHADSASNSALASQSYSIASSNEAERAKSFADQAHGQVQPIIDEGTRQLNRVSAEGLAQVDRVNMAGSGRVADVNRAGASAVQSINERQSWMEENFGKMVTNVNVSVSTNINVNAQDYSFTYTNVEGTAFDYVTVHPYGANGGATVAARSPSAYSTVKIRAWPRPRASGTNRYWDFSPAYIDYDENGMRLQYLPDSVNPIPYDAGTGSYPNGVIVPEYLYWQSGYVYLKVRVFEDGNVVAWCLTRYKWDNWPSTLGYGEDSGYWMTLVSRSGYGTSAMGNNLSALYSLTRTASSNTPIEFPMTPSPSYGTIIGWMKSGDEGRPDPSDKIILYKKSRRYIYTVTTKWENVFNEISYDVDISPDIVYRQENSKIVYSDGAPLVYAEKSSDEWILVFEFTTSRCTIPMGDDISQFPSLNSEIVTFTDEIMGTTYRNNKRIVTFNRSYVSEPKAFRIISSDFNVYDANSNIVDRVVLGSELLNVSNWVERVFQKKIIGE